MKTPLLSILLSVFLFSCGTYKTGDQALPKVGDKVDSGYIFAVDQSARIIYITPAEPLIIPQQIISTEQIWNWNNQDFNPVLELRRARGYGKENTKKIIETFGIHPNKHPYAAAATFYLRYESSTGRIYDDWYLPSIGELAQLVSAYLDNTANLRDNVKPHVGLEFWSSSWGENDPSKACYLKIKRESYAPLEADKYEAKFIWPIRSEYY